MSHSGTSQRTVSAPTPTTVAFLGPAGTFTEAALRLFDEYKETHRRWSGQLQPLPAHSPAEALAAVRQGDAAYACVAIENSIDGVVTATMDALAGSPEDPPVQVFAEVDVPVEFAILARNSVSDVPQNSVQNPGDNQPQPSVQNPAQGSGGDSSSRPVTLSTHPVAYQQVKEWLSKHYPAAEFIPASSNGAAAQSVAEGIYDIAVAPLHAATVFNLKVLAEGIADHPGAKTRFLLVGRPDVPTARTGNDRTSVTFLAPNEPGSLVACLSEFAQRGVDLSRIESRPTKTELGSYRFFVDLVGHIDDAPVSEALRALYLRSQDTRFLGSWPSTEAPKSSHPEQDRIVEASRWVDDLRAGRRR